MNEQDIKRKLTSLKRLLRARSIRKNIPTPYQCFGGPFDGEVIYLETSSTGSFRVGEMLGKYEAQGDYVQRFYTRNQPETYTKLQWQVSA